MSVVIEKPDTSSDGAIRYRAKYELFCTIINNSKRGKDEKAHSATRANTIILSQYNFHSVL